MKTLTQAPLLHLQETLTEDVRRAGQGEGLVYIVLMLVIDLPPSPRSTPSGAEDEGAD